MRCVSHSAREHARASASRSLRRALARRRLRLGDARTLRTLRAAIRSALLRSAQREVALDVGLRRNAPDRFADDVEREIVERLESQTGFAHVELLACLVPSFAQPARLRGLAVLVAAAVGAH